MSECTDGHNFDIDSWDVHISCSRCSESLAIPQAEAILNEHAALKRVRDAAEARRQAARDFLPLAEIRKINKEIDDALADTQEQLTKNR